MASDLEDYEDVLGRSEGCFLLTFGLKTIAFDCLHKLSTRFPVVSCLSKFCLKQVNHY